MSSVEKLMSRIASVKIQGATNVARAGLKGLEITARASVAETKHEFISELTNFSKKIISLRATEPLLRNLINYVLKTVSSGTIDDVKDLRQLVLVACDESVAIIEKNREIIGKLGADTIKEGSKVLTHCHSSTVMDIFREAKSQGKKFEVYCTESRPLFQGRKSAKDIAKMGIPVTMMVDSNVANILRDVSGVYIGSDLITPDGDVANKVGSYCIATLAKTLEVPLYVCSDLGKLSFEKHDNIIIEQRPATEVWNRAPSSVHVLNPAFDVVPHEKVHKYICQDGVLSVDEFKKSAEEKKRDIVEI